MQYRKVEKNGDSLSILGYGCMRFPQKGKSIDEDLATIQLHHAIDNGVNYIDTAMPYHMGASEPFLGRALKGGYREKVKLATKLPPWSVKTRDDMDILLNSQLKNLQTSTIDYYLLHSLDGDSWKDLLDLGVLNFLDMAKEDGKIINAGFSFHGRLDDFKEIVNAYDWEFCMIQYNILDEKNQAGTEGLEYAASKGLAVMVMEPLRGGNLAGRIPREVQAIYDNAPETWSAAEWALRWVWNHSEVTLLLSGMNDMGHIDENLKTADTSFPGMLTRSQLDTIEQVKNTYRDLMRVECTGCRYCMPCPANVDIPTCFEVYNSKHMFEGGKGGTMDYVIKMGGIGGKKSFASQCIQCGKCVNHCPQHIDIPSLMPIIAKEFEKPYTGALLWIIKRFFSYQRWQAARRIKNRDNQVSSSDEK